MKNRNWWDTEVTYEDLVYEHLLVYKSYETIPFEVIEFCAGVLNITVNELQDYLKEKYSEEA